MAEATKGATQAMLGTSIVGTSSVRSYKDARCLVLVPGHAVYIGRSIEHSVSDKYWIGGFPGEAGYYTEHALAGIEEARSSSHLLVFSGGQTREAAGVMSEAQSYWFLGDQYSWNNRDGVKSRALVEDFARDSLENLAFGIGVFARVTERMPDDIVLCGWGFKEDRYRLHADALGISQDQLHYVKVNNPEGSEDDLSSPLGGALKGEKKTVADFIETPFGNDGVLLQKRLQRDPYLRGDNAYLYYQLYFLRQEIFPLLRKRGQS